MQKFRQIILIYETRKWVRYSETILTLLPIYLGALYLAISTEIPDIVTLGQSVWVGIIFSPFLAAGMYRESDLFQFERICILVVTLIYSLFLLSVLNENI